MTETSLIVMWVVVAALIAILVLCGFLGKRHPNGSGLANFVGCILFYFTAWFAAPFVVGGTALFFTGSVLFAAGVWIGCTVLATKFLT